MQINLETTVGTIQLIAKDGCLIRILFPTSKSFPMTDEQVVESTSDEPVFKDAIDYLKRYFNGEPVSWAGKPIPDGSDFYRKVWAATAEIPFGETISYGELARRAGNQKAARAAGSAMANNPLSILVPCHRVIAADGSLGGFGGGLEMKRWLLRHEGVKVK